MDIKRAEKCFANHKATLTDYGNIKILDFKNPKSSEYRIRFLFEEDYCRLHISGDLGELTATNYYNMTYEKFSDMVRDVGYFEGKINCHSRPLYIYDEDAVKEDVLELIKEMYGLEELIEDYRNYDFYSKEEVLEEFYDDILSDFSDSTGISSEARKILAKYIGEYDAYSDDIGKRKTDILDWYMFAFQLAQKQLNDDNAEIKTHPAVDTEKHAYYIDITDLAANAFVEMMFKDESKRFISYETLERYCSEVVNILNSKGKKTTLILSRENTNVMFRNYSDIFEEIVLDNQSGIFLKSEISIENLIMKFRGYLAWDVLLAFVSKQAVSKLGI